VGAEQNQEGEEADLRWLTVVLAGGRGEEEWRWL
jgi:hypothetical protein